MKSDFDYAQMINTLPFAFGNGNIQGDIKTSNLDFKVVEELPFQPSGKGEHLFVKVTKEGCNTEWVAKQLQRFAGLSSRDIGYAGKKDRHSISTQWFSLHLPGKELDLSTFEHPSITIIDSQRHNKKLRVGSVKRNQFEIVVRNLTGLLDQNQIENISKFGFPNYFGPQRFGREFNNLEKARALLVDVVKIKNRNLKGLVISSARSLLFNLQLAERLNQNNWIKAIAGDCMILNESQSYYQLEDVTDAEQHRLDSGDTHVSGWMPGKQLSEAKSLAMESELLALNSFDKWLEGLVRLNVDSARRAYRVFPSELKIVQKGEQAHFSFSLPKGCFATSLLREFLVFNDIAAQDKSGENH